MTAHARLSPSAAHRWMRCPGSVALEATLPEETSPFAEEGTRAHDLAAVILGGLDVTTGDREMLDHVGLYVETVRHIAGDNPIMIEQRVDFSDVVGVPNSFGTSDCIILDGDTITLVDLKYGRGVRVDAEENEQLMLYALGALNDYGMVNRFTKARLVIVQPRLSHISEWEVSVEDLMVFAQRVKERAAIALGSSPEFEAGPKQCRFCKAKAICPALLSAVHDEVMNEFDVVRDPKTLSNEDLGRSLAQVEMIEEWCAAVRKRTETQLMSGIDVPGWKLVAGRRGARRWQSDGQVSTYLKNVARLDDDAIFEKSLISPTAAERLVKEGRIPKEAWEGLQGLITQPEGKPTVAPISDKRSAVASVADDFENLN